MSQNHIICNSVITTLSALSHLPTESLLVFSHHLWGHEGRCPCRAGQEGVRPFELVAYAKVGDLDVSVVPQQEVGRFNVSVDDLVVVHWTEWDLQ